MKRHLRAVAADAGEKARHAAALLGDLIAWGAGSNQLDALIRLPLDPVEEEVRR